MGAAAVADVFAWGDAMNFHILEEYVEFSKYLNFSVAARALHMSQSSLSKHLSNLEAELGVDLVSRQTPPKLTPAGNTFLEYAEETLYSYKEIVNRCREAQRGHSGKLVIQDPVMDSTIANQTIGVFMHFAENYPLVSLDLYPLRGHTITDALLEGAIDVGYLMAYGDIDTIIEQKRQAGIVVHPLRRRKFAVWMKRSHALADVEKLYVGDLRDSPFLLPADRLFDDWRIVLENLCVDHGFFPKIKLKVTATMNGYFTLNVGDGVVILSEAFLQDPRFLMREDMKTHTLADEDCHYTLFFAYKESNTNPILPLFVERLKTASEL